MQPFSFFQILQSLLPKQPENTEPENEALAESAPPPDEAPSPPPSDKTDAQTAFLHFMETHEKRARRTRK